MKAIILARVSTEEQKEAGNSLPAQQARLLSYINKTPELELTKQFIFDESAYKEKRDKFDSVLEYIEAQEGVIAFCCDKIDRLSRDFLNGIVALENMRRSGKIILHFPSDNLVLHKDSPATDLFHFNVAVSLAQYYSNSISDNVKRSYEQKIRRGEWVGAAPLGYINIQPDEDHKDIIVDKSKSHLIEETFRLYATGKYSMRKLSKMMYEKGLLSRKGKKVTTSQIQTMLRKHFYYGVMELKGKQYPHKYEPIISKNLFDKVQRVIESYNKQNFKRTNKPYIFRGLIKCAECGCSITPEIKKGKYIYYHCTNYHGDCKNVVWISEDKLLKQVAPALQSLKLEPDALEKLKSELRSIHEAGKIYYEKNLAVIKKKIDVIENRLEVMYEDKLDGRISAYEYDKRVEKYKKEQEKLWKQCEQNSNSDRDFYITASKILDLSSKAWELFKSSEPEEKTQLLNFVFQNFSLEGKKLLYEAKNPFSGVIDYSKTGKWLRGQDSNL